MISTKNLTIHIDSIPSTWVFEHYLDLPEKLAGQDVKITSIFNPAERTPSMCIFVDKVSNQYRYKDFSTGKGGSKIDLIKELYDNVDTYSKAVFKIIEDFNLYVLKHGTCENWRDYSNIISMECDFTMFKQCLE